MKKVIKGAVYNTKTAKKICEQVTEEFENEKGADVRKVKQLFKTRSGKYFFFIKNKFIGYADINNDDLNPVFEQMELEEEKIVPVSYELALQFASEMKSEQEPESEKLIDTYFPELADNGIDENEKIQKKLYISKKANWYLEMMLIESEETNSSIIEKLIVNEYQRLYLKGKMTRDPYSEMEDELNN